MGETSQHLIRSDAGGGEIGKGDGSVSLGQTFAIATEYERNVGVDHRAQPEHLDQPRLARGAVEEVVAPYDFPDALRVVVDNDGEVVGRYAVFAAHDEIVDDRCGRAVEPVLDGHRGAVGTHAPRLVVSRRAPALQSLRREVAARPWVGAVGSWSVGCLGRVGDLSTGAETWVEPAGRGEGTESIEVGGATVGVRLPDDRAIPVESQRSQVGEVGRNPLVAACYWVEVLDP
jgi:hypothetical protein